MSKKFNYVEKFNAELPYDLYKNNDIESKAMGSYLNKVQNMTDLLELEVSPISCSFQNLINWELFLELPSNTNDSIKDRRIKVLLELFQYMGDENVIRKDEMESILKLYGGNPEVLEFPSEYKFIIKYMESEGLELDDINKIIKKVKPSYLDYLISLIYNENILIEENYSKLNVKFNISGETKTKDNKVHSNTENIAVDEEYISIKNIFDKSGDTKSKDTESMVSKEKLEIESEYIKIIHDYPIVGNFSCGGGIL